MTERMWAPWRMSYILGEKQGACVFCEMASAPASAYREKLVLVVQPHAFVCLNRYPFATSHLLVVPRRHVPGLGDLPGDEYTAWTNLLREATARLTSVTKPQGLNVGMNLGAAAGAGIAEHLHAHVVPRWNGDTNFMPVLGGVRTLPQSLEATWARLTAVVRDMQQPSAAVRSA